MHRRQFLESSALALAATGVAPLFAAETAPVAAAERPLVVFTKMLEKVPADELAEKVAALGVSGIEAPIRAGGHIEPKDVPDKLPAFAEALKKRGLEITILSSDVDQVNAEQEAVLRTAVSLGIKRYRLKHYRYDLKKPIAPQLADVRAKLIDIAAMNKELGIQGQYQNHRGNDFVGAPVWDMVSALDGIDPAQLGLAFDLAHATVEGGNAWELNMHRAAQHIVSVYFKDYRLDGRQWNPCPLGEGSVNPRSARLVSQLLPAGTPVSIHIEYIGGQDHVARTFDAMKNDVATLRKWLAPA
ncbi:sugar phosphate isomerase/epimerase [Luteolibacter flavescens]|uniref:Sugar phosphate isomerase/epimerase n=1 Tax=Luteolibacter flavescens TaxID=1859460 RepID=A0ABT3FNH2_9BACT|nr:sugar phosphate isomerase/epimerase [Luteolibacter flavescens]MCW1885114.1 sugar phosphate isomerase/epimerase [Luteolibacter flavescens]